MIKPKDAQKHGEQFAGDSDGDEAQAAVMLQGVKDEDLAEGTACAKE